MLYYLSEFIATFPTLRLFDYVTFRAGGAALTSFLLVILLGSRTAALLRRFNAQSAERYRGLIPDEFIDKDKNSTPCMGGLLLIGGVLVSSLLWTAVPQPIPLALIGGTFGFAAIGFIDDFLKVRFKRRDGLPGKLKLLGQFVVAAAVLWGFASAPRLSPFLPQLWIPFVKDPFEPGVWVTMIFAAVVIVGSSNAVNLTDGKDGLATGCTIFCTLTYAVFAYLMGHKYFAAYLNIPFISGAEEAVVYAAALCGGCIGFLWHNCPPASMFMGDTGSLALGGGVGMLAVLVRQELLLLLVGGVFVLEAVSVILQVASFKLTGKRIFLCAPIHHHFERKGWRETQIVVRFWILAGVFALMALATLKLR